MFMKRHVPEPRKCLARRVECNERDDQLLHTALWDLQTQQGTSAGKIYCQVFRPHACQNRGQPRDKLFFCLPALQEQLLVFMLLCQTPVVLNNFTVSVQQGVLTLKEESSHIKGNSHCLGPGRPEVHHRTSKPYPLFGVNSLRQSFMHSTGQNSPHVPSCHFVVSAVQRGKCYSQGYRPQEEEWSAMRDTRI